MDKIEDLPIKNKEISVNNDDIKLLKKIFFNSSSTTAINKNTSDFRIKNYIILFVLFILFSLPQVDSLLEKFTSFSNNIYVIIIIKAIILIIIYFILSNIHLIFIK